MNYTFILPNGSIASTCPAALGPFLSCPALSFLLNRPNSEGYGFAGGTTSVCFHSREDALLTISFVDHFDYLTFSLEQIPLEK